MRRSLMPRGAFSTTYSIDRTWKLLRSYTGKSNFLNKTSINVIRTNAPAISSATNLRIQCRIYHFMRTFYGSDLMIGKIDKNNEHVIIAPRDRSSRIMKNSSGAAVLGLILGAAIGGNPVGIAILFLVLILLWLIW